MRFGDIAWTALKASEKIRKPFESWIKALGNKGGPFLRDEFSVTPKTLSISIFENTWICLYMLFRPKTRGIHLCVLLFPRPQKLPDLDENFEIFTTGTPVASLGCRCFRVLLGEIENLDLDAAPGEGRGWDAPGLVGLVDVEMNFRMLLKCGDMYIYRYIIIYMNDISTDYIPRM